MVKASLVVLFFMHLKYDRPFNAVVLVASVFFLILFLGLALLDTLHYRDNLIPGYAPGIAAPAAPAAPPEPAAPAARPPPVTRPGSSRCAQPAPRSSACASREREAKGRTVHAAAVVALRGGV